MTNIERQHGLERRPDDGDFSNLHADFEQLRPALEMLSGVDAIQDGDITTRIVAINSPFGILILNETIHEDKVEHDALAMTQDLQVRGIGFKDGKFKTFHGYSPYTSNKEIARFLNGFSAEAQRNNFKKRLEK